MTGWPWPLDAVQGWFESFWASLEHTVNSSVDWLWERIEPYVSPVKAALEGAGAALWADLNNFLRDPVAAISSGLNWLKERVEEKLAPVAAALKGAGAALWASLDNFLRDPVAALTGGLGWIVDRVGEKLQPIVAAIDQLPGIFTGAIKNVSVNVGTIVNAGATWLRSEILTALDGGVAGIQNLVSGVLQGVAAAFGEGLKNFWNWIVSNMPGMFSSVGAWINSSVVQPLWGSFKWLWDMISGAARNVLEHVVKAARDVAARIKAGDPTAAFELLATFAGMGLATQGIMSIAGLKIAGTGIEVGEIGHYMKDLLSPSMFTGAVIGTLVGAAIRTPLSQYYNTVFRNQLPDESNLRVYYLRGLIPEDRAREVLAKYGLADDFIKAEMESWWIIPSVSDLITFVVREVITPEEFYSWAAKQGLSKYWAENYWEAHWVLPSFSNLREAFWRGIITQEEFRKYVVWHDYKPEPRSGISKSDQDIMFELSYELPGRIDARWMFEQGAITMEQLKQLYKMSGLHPDWLDATVEATARAVLRSEIESIVREAMYDYRDGWLTRDEFKAVMESLGLAPKLQEYWLARADMLAAREMRDEQYKIFLESYRLGIISEETFRKELLSLGMVEEKVERVIYLENLRKIGKTAVS